MFAKLYETHSGQILVKADSDEDSKPEVRFYFKPENLGVCSMAVSFADTDDGWDKQESFFNTMNQEKAVEAVNCALSKLPI
jgi:hypothetical protein